MYFASGVPLVAPVAKRFSSDVEQLGDPNSAYVHTMRGPGQTKGPCEVLDLLPVESIQYITTIYDYDIVIVSICICSIRYIIV